MPAEILVVGALHYDVVVTAQRLPVLDETLPGDTVSYVFGGKGGNQAVAAARHGGKVAFAGCVGSDPPGDFLLETLDREGIDRRQVEREPDRSSGMSVAIVTESGEYAAVIISDANRAIDAEHIALPEGVRLLILQNEIPEAVNLATARRARNAGVKVLLNAAPARTISSDLLALVDCLIVNRVEAEQLSSELGLETAEPGELATQLSGPELDVILTLGHEGCIVAQRSAAVTRIPAFDIETVSAHGAGDCFTGALATRCVAGDSLIDAARYATAASALHVGASPDRRQAITVAQTLSLLRK